MAKKYAFVAVWSEGIEIRISSEHQWLILQAHNTLSDFVIKRLVCGVVDENFSGFAKKAIADIDANDIGFEGAFERLSNLISELDSLEADIYLHRP